MFRKMTDEEVAFVADLAIECGPAQVVSAVSGVVSAHAFLAPSKVYARRYRQLSHALLKMAERTRTTYGNFFVVNRPR